MRYIIILISFLSLVIAKNVVVSILPQKEIVQKIAGQKVDVDVVVPPGSEPHTFEPKPSTMKKISNADIYYAIGVEFEESWLDKFQSQNPKMKIVHLDKNITKINQNPHIWLSLRNLQVIADKVYNSLDEKSLKENLNLYKSELKSCDNEIKNILQKKKNRTFMSVHPAFAYFAKDYNLTQIAVEKDEKEPSLKELLNLLKKAKKKGVKIIITSPEFSDKSAKIISNELGIKVLKISPLEPNICNSLKKIAKSL